jgi:hypothetical protein
MANNRAQYDIVATDKTQAAIASAKRGFREVESSADAVKLALGGIGAAVALMGLDKMAQAAMEAEQASNRLTAVIRATGGAAGVAKSEIDDLADAMAQTTEFDDESIRNAAGTFLKFGNIQEDIFRQGMKLAADYASFVGGDMNDAAQVIGKALQSPEEGLTSLERQVGKLTNTQKESIKSFMEQGRVMEAQKVILDALDKKIGGTAELMNQGLTKRIKDIKKNTDELFESLGKSAPGDSFLDFLNASLKDMKRIVESGDWVAAVKFLLGFRGMDVNAGPQSSASGTIKGGPLDPAIAALQARIDAAKERAAALQKKRDEEAAKARKEADDVYAKGAQKRVEMDDEANQKAAQQEEQFKKRVQHFRELNDPTQQYRDMLLEINDLEERGYLMAEEAEQMRQTVYQKTSEELDGNVEQYRRLKDETEKTDDVARQLGLTFSSAFEDAISGGKGLREVLGGILMDIAKIAVRKSITEPIANAVGGAMGGLNLGNIFGGGTQAPAPVADATFLGSFATGAENLPRDGLAFVHKGEDIVPANQARKGGITIGSIDMRGASVEAVIRLEMMLKNVSATIEARAVRAVQQTQLRGVRV